MWCSHVYQYVWGFLMDFVFGGEIPTRKLRTTILPKLHFTTNLKSSPRKFKLLNVNVLYSKVICVHTYLFFKHICFILHVILATTSHIIFSSTTLKTKLLCVVFMICSLAYL